MRLTRFRAPLPSPQVDALLASDGIIEDRCVARKVSSSTSGNVEDTQFRVIGRQVLLPALPGLIWSDQSETSSLFPCFLVQIPTFGVNDQSIRMRQS